MRRLLALLLFFGAVSLIVALTRQQHEVVTTFTGWTMGTSYTVRLVGRLTEGERDSWQEKIDRVLDEVNGDMSTYQADSDVCRFNRDASGQWWPVSANTARVVAAALKLGELTDGAFDITVAPLVNLWSFGPDQRPRGIPAEDEIQLALKRVGYQQVEARLSPPALRKVRADVSIDLSGIAKGFAVDQVAELFEQNGISSYMIEIGGEVRTRGTKPQGQAWKIGLERPWAKPGTIQSVITVQDCCLASSGNYRNFFEWEGKIYSHEIDPATGWPVRRSLVAVSVIGSTVMQADALATGFMVLKPDQVWHLAEKLGVEACLIWREGEEFRQSMTPGFAALTDSSKRLP